jgi:O-glycosyl hydrolase
MDPRIPRGRWLRSLLALLAVLVPLLGATPAAAGAPSAPPGSVAITRLDAYRFQGWGTSLAWWANVVGGWSGANRQSIEDELFRPSDAAHPDRLGLSVVRYNVGASSTTGNPPVAAGMPACLPFGPGKAVPTPVPGPGQPVDLGLDANQVQVLTEARERIGRAAVLQAFANSPPWWMTVTGCPQGSRTLFGDNLAQARDGDYVEYLAQVLDAFRARGVAFDTVEPFNEPEVPWGALPCANGCQEGDHFDPFNGHQSQVLTQLCDRLQAHGLATRAAAPDSFNPDLTIADTGLMSQAARDCLARFDTHMYSQTPTGDLVPYQGASRRALADLAAAQGKPTWMSEFGTGGTAADLGSALTLSLEIAKDTRYQRPVAWVNWQAVEATGGWGLFEAPQWPAETAGGGGRPVVETRRFYAMEQYSRFIRPGYTMLTAADPFDDPVHETTPTLAAVDDLRAPRRIVIVGTTGAQGRDVTYDLAPLGVAGLQERARVTRYRTSASGNVQRLDPVPVPLRAMYFSDAQPASSITTYVVDFPPDRHGAGLPPFEPTTTRVASSETTAAPGQPVTFTATVTGGQAGDEREDAPTGAVTFQVGSTVLGTARLDHQGQASLTVADLPAGTSEVRAVYKGDRRFLPTSGGVAQVVGGAPSPAARGA